MKSFTFVCACVAWSVLALSACTRPNPASCQDGYCQDPALPFCDVDGSIDGTPMTCVAVECAPGEFAGCRGADQALVCNNAGDNYDVNHCTDGCTPGVGCNVTHCEPNTTSCGDGTVEVCDADGVLHTTACELGCVDAPQSHCAYISPVYLPDACDALALEPTHTVSDLEPLNTDSTPLCNGGIVSQGAGVPEICVVRYGTLTIASTGALVVTGSRALAVVTDGPLRVDGIVNASASGQIEGPGGGMRKLPSGPPSDTRGGGGAGFSTAGADGGTTTAAGGAANGGDQIDPLIAGTLQAGTSAKNMTHNNGAEFGGGGAGGALMLVSCRDEVSVQGTLLDHGGGGRGGYRTTIGSLTRLFGGAGGGSGGYVVLQGLNVRVSGTVLANGGGGGCGKPSGGSDGVAGHDSTGLGAAAACSAGSDEGSGGAGGTATAAPQPGGASSGGTPGGGGGSIGAFQSYTPESVIPTLTPAVQSPGFRPNRHVMTR